MKYLRDINALVSKKLVIFAAITALVAQPFGVLPISNAFAITNDAPEGFGASSDVAVSPTIQNVDASYVKTNEYSGIYVGFAVHNLNGRAQSLEVRANRSSGGAYSMRATDSLLNILNDSMSASQESGGTLIITGSRVSGSWTPQVGTWSGPADITSVDVVVVLNDGTTQIVGTDTAIRDNGASVNEVIPADVSVSGVDASYVKTNEYTGIYVGFDINNIKGRIADLEVRVNRNGGAPYSMNAMPSLVAAMNSEASANHFGSGGTIIIDGSRTSGSWTPQKGTWFGSDDITSVEVIATLKDGTTRVGVDSVIRNNGATKADVFANIDVEVPEVTTFNQVNDGVGRVKVTLIFSEAIVGLGQGWNEDAGSNSTKFSKVYFNSKPHTVTFNDIAGNQGTYTFTTDAEAPDATIVLDRTTNPTKATMTARDNNELKQVDVSLRKNNTTVVALPSESITSGREYTFDYATLLDLDGLEVEGVYTVRITVTDATGNSNDFDSDSFTIDRTGPNLVINQPIDAANPYPVIFGSSDPSSEIQIFLNGNDVGSVNADSTGAWSWKSAVALQQGSYQFMAISEDEYENKSEYFVIFTILAPNVPVPPIDLLNPIEPALQDLGGSFNRQSRTAFVAAVNNGNAVIDANDNEGEILGAAKDTSKNVSSVAKPAIEPSEEGWRVLGLAWYWWVLVVAALAGAAWYATEWRRNRTEV